MVNPPGTKPCLRDFKAAPFTKQQVAGGHPHVLEVNLGMAVQVLTYELRAAGIDREQPVYEPDAPLATSEDMEHFYTHLENVLTDIRFLDPENPRHLMRRLQELVHYFSTEERRATKNQYVQTLPSYPSASLRNQGWCFLPKALPSHH